MKRIHLLLGIQSLLAIFVSFNRLTDWFTGYVLPNQFLRWVDLNNVIVALISMIAVYLLKKTLEYNSPTREGSAHTAWNLVFMIGVFLTAVSYGFHELANYLHFRFCLDDSTSDLCRIIIFNDDEFSHWLFFAGFTMVNAAILFLQNLFPHKENLSGTDITLLLLNSLFLGAGIFANLGFETIGLDLYVVALLAIISTILLWKRGRQPMFIYYAAAYWLGLAGSLIAQAVR
ncbi:MAG: hypothetical protein DCC56_07845 [Anaerolineae bacterium]|nr:hypothetical protein [Anaerolineales bacterium]RIK30239.1 MAG: hypothetical protein DCC56_07845 [Anaerolineae bacterium]WKZ45501.1 MAG: hypothetical protein QY302_06885 [Anaerolineales bacterium]WKZ48119.1 MAG: hypothetical protein QY306_01970 [Anaerolineales bacterium]